MNPTDNPRRRLETRSVTDQAAEWLVALEDGGADKDPAFADWLRESPTHVQAYLRAATLDTLMRNMDPGRSVRIETAAEPAVRELGLLAGELPSRPRRRYLAAAAAMAGVSILGWTAFTLTVGTWNTYSTDIGEQRSVSLEDGSTLTLNTDSRVRVRFNGHERQLRLIAGEAIFRVQRDPERPFSVTSGNTVVRVVGTEFNVYRKADETVVSVLEGRVAVAGALLGAGEGIRVADDGSAMEKSLINFSNVTSWRQRRLVFIDEPLGSIVHEFNRYNREPRLEVREEAAAQRRYTMILDADDPKSLLAILAGDPRVKTERREGRILIRPR